MAKVFRGIMSGRFYYAPRVQRHRSGAMMVVGKKIDITEELLPYLKKKYWPKEYLEKKG